MANTWQHKAMTKEINLANIGETKIKVGKLTQQKQTWQNTKKLGKTKKEVWQKKKSLANMLGKIKKKLGKTTTWQNNNLAKTSWQ